MGRQPWRGVEWSLLYVGFLAYVLTITTYMFPIGDIAIAAAFAGLLFERGGFRFPPLVAFLGAFLAWCALGYTQASYPAVTLEELIALGKLWLIVLIACNALTTRARIRFFMLFSLGCYALYPVRGAFFNYFGGHTTLGRALWNHIFANPNDLAALTLLQFSMATALLAAGVRGWTRWAAIGGMLVLPALVLLTQSRGGLIALAIFVIAAFGAHKRKGQVAGAITVVSVVLMIAMPASLWDRIGSLGSVTSISQLESRETDSSARQRFEIWKVALSIISDHPVAGVGWGSYHKAHEPAALSARFDPIARGERDAHSTVLRVAAETGVPGVLLFGWLILAIMLRVDRQRRAVASVLPRTAFQLLVLEFGVGAFFIAGIWGSFAHLSFLYLHLALLAGLAETARRELAAQSPAAVPALRVRRR